MTQDEITKAFENRWRIKAKDNVELIPIALPVDMKELCRDFFEAGAAIGYDAKKIVTKATEIRPCKHNEIQFVDIEMIPHMLGKNDGFDKWWDVYDKKCGRKKCLEKWKKLTPTDRYLCLVMTPAYVESTPDIKFRKNPLTYLNGECWNDQIIPYNGADNKSSKQQQDLNKLASILTD